MSINESRLLDSPNANPLLKEALQSAALDQPSDGQLLALEAKLASLGHLGAASWYSGLWLKILGGLAILGGVALVVVMQARTPDRAEDPTLSEQAPMVTTGEAVPELAQVAEPNRVAAAVTSIDAGSVQATPIDAASIPSKSSRKDAAGQDGSAKGHRETNSKSAPSELSLLHEMRQELRKGSYRRSRALLSQHRKYFPKSQFAEERSAISVEALIGLGKNDRAKRELRSFSSRFPNSNYLARLQGLLPLD